MTEIDERHACDHSGQASTYCTVCWINLYETRQQTFVEPTSITIAWNRRFAVAALTGGIIGGAAGIVGMWDYNGIANDFWGTTISFAVLLAGLLGVLFSVIPFGLTKLLRENNERPRDGHDSGELSSCTFYTRPRVTLGRSAAGRMK